MSAPIRRRCGAKRASAIVLGMNYGPEHDPLEILTKKDRAAISVYAQGDDYHDVVKKKLKAVAGFIYEKAKAEVKVFVDTAPVMEKPLAQKAGLGWQGKHTNLVSREFGSWLFLGSIFTTLELPPDEGEKDHCGNCQPLPGCLSHRRLPRALQTGCAALHFLSHHREQGPYPARIPRKRWAIASMAATIAWRSVPGTNSRKPRRR